MFNKVIMTVGVVLVCSVGVFMMYSFFVAPPKTGYIDTLKVYDSFELTKELEQQYYKAEDARNKILDSLRLQLQLGYRALQNDAGNNDRLQNQYTTLREYYQEKNEEFTSVNELTQRQYSEQIWEQLNQYIVDFGETKDYDYIYGANGQGSLMYARDRYELTEQVIEYVNQRYNGYDE